MQQRANDIQVGGSHYRGAKCPHCQGDLQHWDIAWVMNFDIFQYIITKWVFRWRKKGGLEDLRKARHALDKYIEVVSADMDDGAEPQPHGYVDQG